MPSNQTVQTHHLNHLLDKDSLSDLPGLLEEETLESQEEVEEVEEAEGVEEEIQEHLQQQLEEETQETN